MDGARSMIGFVNRYVMLAGRSCCAGRSWVGLDRTLARWQDDPAAASCQPPSGAAGDDSGQTVLGARHERDQDDGSLATSSPTRR